MFADSFENTEETLYRWTIEGITGGFLKIPHIFPIVGRGKVSIFCVKLIKVLNQLLSYVAVFFMW